MRRFWIGVILLAVLLAAGLWTSRAMDRIHTPIGTLLDGAAEAAQQEDWSRAELLATQARDAWAQSRHTVAALADHTPMDELDGLFAQLPIFLRQRDTAHFAVTCAELSQLARAMGEAHAPDWWNLL